MEQVVFAGDWHGNLLWATSRLQSIGSSGPTTILHVGDFGIWPGSSGKRYLHAVENTCARYDLNIMITPGNHEDWARLTTLWANPKRRDPGTGEALPLHLTEHVQVLPRGHRSPSAGRTFLPSGGPVDVLITHDTPESEWCVPAVRETLARNPHGWPQDSLTWAAVSRSRVNRVFEAVRPRLLVHGHHHVWGDRSVHLPGAGHQTRVVSLGADGEAGNVWRLDLDTVVPA